MSKIFNFQFSIFKLQNPEAGITLVMSIVMLATVTFVSFALSTIIIREIAAARVILRTEPAIAGANSGGEIGLYRLFRGISGSAVTGSVSSGGAGYIVTTDYYDNPYLFQAVSGQEITVALYDAENQENKSTGYTSVTISNNSGSQPIKTRVVTWSWVEYTGQQRNPEQCPEMTTPAGQYRACTLNAADGRYVIYIQPTGGGSANGSVTAAGGSPTNGGIPADSPSLDVTGTGNGVQRKIQIKL